MATRRPLVVIPGSDPQVQVMPSGDVLDSAVMPQLVTVHQDYSDATYSYLSKTVNGAWQIDRFAKATFVRTVATQSNNGSYSTESAAWAARTSLTYA